MELPTKNVDSTTEKGHVIMPDRTVRRLVLGTSRTLSLAYKQESKNGSRHCLGMLISEHIGSLACLIVCTEGLLIGLEAVDVQYGHISYCIATYRSVHVS